MTPSTVIFDALNPATAQNISNYSLINTSENDEDESQYIATATFVATSPTLNAGTNNYVLDYNGYINLTFLPGLPAGVYTFVAHTTELQYPGLTDAAGNPLDDTARAGRGNQRLHHQFRHPARSPSTSRAWRSKARTTATARP